MADNYAFDGANKVFSDPHKDENDRPDIWSFFNGLTVFSKWRLSPEELAEINASGEVCLAQLLGKNVPMPATFVGSERNIRIATMDLAGRPMPGPMPKKVAPTIN